MCIYSRVGKDVSVGYHSIFLPECKTICNNSQKYRQPPNAALTEPHPVHLCWWSTLSSLSHLSESQGSALRIWLYLCLYGQLGTSSSTTRCSKHALNPFKRGNDQSLCDCVERFYDLCRKVKESKCLCYTVMWRTATVGDSGCYGNIHINVNKVWTSICTCVDKTELQKIQGSVFYLFIL